MLYIDEPFGVGLSLPNVEADDFGRIVGLKVAKKTDMGMNS